MSPARKQKPAPQARISAYDALRLRERQRKTQRVALSRLIAGARDRRSDDTPQA